MMNILVLVRGLPGSGKSTIAKSFVTHPSVENIKMLTNDFGDTWYQVKGLIESGKLHLKELVTHVLPYTQYEEAFSLMESGQCGKIVLMFNQEESK